MHQSKIIPVLVLCQCSLLIHCSFISSSWSDWLWWLTETDQSSFTLDQDLLERHDPIPFEDERFLSQKKSTSLCGPSVFDPVGECRHYGKCLASGGAVDAPTPGCSGLFAGYCCKYVVGCNTKLMARVAYWQSPNYPAEATGSTSCTLTVQPHADTCFVKVQFLDTLLTASTVDNCDGNILTINNQAEGDSSLICGSLDNYETIVRVRRTPWKLKFTLLENLRLDLKMRDTRYSYNIKITQITCPQINGISGGVTPRSIDFSGRSTDRDLLDADPNQIFPKPDQKKYIHLKEKYKDRILELNIADSADLATQTEEDIVLSNAVDSGVIQSETSTPVIMDSAATKVPSHLDLGNSETIDLVTSLTSQLDQTNQKIFPIPNQKNYIHLKEKYKDRILELNTADSADLATQTEEDIVLGNVVDSEVIQSATSIPVIMDFATTKVPSPLDLGNSETMDLVTSLTSQLDQTNQEIFPTLNQNKYIHLKEKYKDRILELNSADSADLATQTEEDIFLSNVVDLGVIQSETPAITNFETTKAPLRLDSGNLDTLDLVTSLTHQLYQTNQETSVPSSNFPTTLSPQQLATLNQDEIFPILVLSEESSATTTTATRPQNIKNPTSTEANDATNSTIDLVELTRLASESGIVNVDGTVSVGALCSVAGREATQRIAGTPNSLMNRASYFGSVIIRSEADDYSFCGATLIAPTYVLTAASCLLRRGYDRDMYDIRVFFDQTLAHQLPGFARTFLDIWDWPVPIRYAVKRVVFHPMYDHNNFHYDIAVMELKTAVTAPNTPIALPQRGNLFENVPVVEMGFGLKFGQTLLRPSYYANIASYTKANTITNVACQSFYANAPPIHTSYTGQFIKDEMICVSPAHDKLNEQVCEGDQGGPMVANFDGNEVLVGIISGNQLNCIHPELGSTLKLGNYPDIAVRITSVLDFINAATTIIEYDVGAGGGGASFWDTLKGFWTIRFA